MKYPEVYEDNGIKILDDLNEKNMTDSKVQATPKLSRHNHLYIFIIIQDYYELPKKTNRANGNMYHNLKPNNFRDVQNLYQDKASIVMTPNKNKYLTSTCWDKKYQYH